MENVNPLRITRYFNPSPIAFYPEVQQTGAIPSRFVTTLCVARSTAPNWSYVHPMKTRPVPTYSGGYFTQDTVPSVQNRRALLATVAVSRCKFVGAIPSCSGQFLAWIYGLVYLHILLEVGCPYIENSMPNTLVPVANLYHVACTSCRAYKRASTAGLFRPPHVSLYCICMGERNSPG